MIVRFCEMVVERGNGRCLERGEGVSLLSEKMVFGKQQN